MRSLIIEDKFVNKFIHDSHGYDDISSESINSFTPGEWVKFVNTKDDFIGVGFVNPNVLAGPPLYFVTKNLIKKEPEKILINQLNRAIDYRFKFSDYRENSRLCFGASDGLPGLIIDSYTNNLIVQINTAGIDKYRHNVEDYLKERFPNQKVIFLDNKEYRKNEVLPEYDKQELTNAIEISEQGINFEVPASKMQKVGYYYDHRENRLKLANFISRLSEKPANGLDLFCYVGSWGISALKSGVSDMTFVDQADMGQTILETITKNNINSESKFLNEDVFKFLDNCKFKYDLIISDPPAFSKNQKNLKNALRGYQKLYKKIIPLLNDESYLVVASCTHGVTIEDLDLIIERLASDNERNVKLLDLGIQGFDHGMKSLRAKENYIKYLLYYFE